MNKPIKKYFWLKLKYDFFAQKEIKKLRKIAGGDTYTIIYLKIQLLSLKNNGKIFYDGIEETFAEELALELDEETDNVIVTLSFLEKCGLLEKVENDEFLLPQTTNCIGSESSSAARVRKHRKNEKALQCNTSVTNSNTEKEIEIDKEIEIEINKKIKPVNHPLIENPITVDPDKDVSGETGKPKKTSDIVYPADFKRFWDEYPKKIGVRDAIKCWKARIKEGVEAEEMIIAAKNYALAEKRTEARFIKQPARFIGTNKPYEDYVKGCELFGKSTGNDSGIHTEITGQPNWGNFYK